MKIEEVNVDGTPDQFPWHLIFLCLSCVGIGILIGVCAMVVAGRLGWWDYI